MYSYFVFVSLYYIIYYIHFSKREYKNCFTFLIVRKCNKLRKYGTRYSIKKLKYIQIQKCNKLFT